MALHPEHVLDRDQLAFEHLHCEGGRSDKLSPSCYDPPIGGLSSYLETSTSAPLVRTCHASGLSRQNVRLSHRIKILHVAARMMTRCRGSRTKPSIGTVRRAENWELGTSVRTRSLFGYTSRYLRTRCSRKELRREVELGSNPPGSRTPLFLQFLRIRLRNASTSTSRSRSCYANRCPARCGATRFSVSWGRGSIGSC